MLVFEFIARNANDKHLGIEAVEVVDANPIPWPSTRDQKNPDKFKS